LDHFGAKKLHSGPDLQKKLHSEPNLLQWPRSQQRDITLPLPLYYRFFYALSTNFADLFFFFSVHAGKHNMKFLDNHNSPSGYIFISGTRK
jgi:hypothetical protein